MKTDKTHKTELTYRVRCRYCGSITNMFFGFLEDLPNEKYFKIWVSEHSTFPIEKQCNCDNGSMMLHDIVSYRPLI